MTDYSARYGRIIEAMHADQLDALLVMSPNGTCYLSGCYIMTQVAIPDRHAYVLLLKNGEISYLVCNIEEHQAREHGAIEDVHIYVEFNEEPASAAARIIKSHGLERGRIAVEAQAIPAESVHLLSQALPGLEFVHWDKQFKALQMVKDADEVQALETAGRITQTAIENAFASAAPGCTESEVAREIANGMMNGAITPMFSVFVSGPRTLLAHGDPSGRVMQPGDIIRLDVVGRHVSNYLADMARTGVVGEPSPEQNDLFHKVYNAQQAVLEAVKPGIPASELYHVCARSYDEQGMPFTMPHIGHGMGIGLHEAPMIHPANSTILQPGMVLNIEPFVLRKDRHEAYHVEDLVVVTDDGARLLTTPQKSLLQIQT